MRPSYTVNWEHRQDINLDEIDCKPRIDKFIESLKEIFTEGMIEHGNVTEKYTICANEKMQEHSVFNQIIKIFVIKDIHLNYYQYIGESESFVNLMIKVKMLIKKSCTVQ